MSKYALCKRSNVLCTGSWDVRTTVKTSTSGLANFLDIDNRKNIFNAYKQFHI